VVEASAATNLVQNGDFSQFLNGGGPNTFLGFTQVYPGKGYSELADWSYMSYNLALGAGNDSRINGAVYTTETATTTGAIFPFSSDGTGTDIPLAGPGNGVDNGFTGPPSGDNFLADDGSSSFQSAVSQTVSGLVVGEKYNLNFEWAVSQLVGSFVNDTPCPPCETAGWQVSIGTDNYATPVITYPGKGSGQASFGFEGWFDANYVFTATSSSELLTFLAVGTPSGAPPLSLLSDVSVSVAPEPSTWAMMLIGFGGLGFAAYRSRCRKMPAAA
jgi:hypothetical protein